jgi:hypothetical protein
MQIVIDIPEEYYNAIKSIPNIQCDADMLIIKSGTPLQKHGRLIDADELLKAIDTWDKFGYTTGRNLIRLNQGNKDMYVAYIHFDDSVNCIKNMPTIIPADKEAENDYQRRFRRRFNQ